MVDVHGTAAGDELEKDNAEAEDVGLGGEKVRGSVGRVKVAESAGGRGERREGDGETEVGETRVEGGVKKDVGGFDVTVDDRRGEGVEEGEGEGGEEGEVETAAPWRRRRRVVEKVVERTGRHELEKRNGRRGMSEAEKVDDEGGVGEGEEDGELGEGGGEFGGGDERRR